MILLIEKLAAELQSIQVYPKKIILFGSYAKGTPRAHSDIDLAVWAKGFEGIRPLDIEKIAPILRSFPDVEIHTFSEFETVDDNPFIEEVERHGIDYSHLIHRKCMLQ